MDFFRSGVKITGKHAETMQRLCKDKGNGDNDIPFEVKDVNGKLIKVSIFDTRINCFLVAAMLGIINKRQSDKDTASRTDITSTIFGDMFGKYNDELNRIYQHMVLNDVETTEPNSKIKKAFTVDSDEDTSEPEEKILSYVRGGLEILEEYFDPEQCTSYDQVCSAIIDLVNSVDTSYEEES